jgi:hypothetical protein
MQGSMLRRTIGPGLAIHALQYAYGLGAGDTEPRELIPAYFTELFLDYTFHSDPQVAQLIQQLANLANDGGKATLPLYLAKRDQLAAKIGQVSKVL